ncbi:alpha-N-acetylglucosaminidase [Danaus plexippus]|uniref:alpha-N-acetylglucosaminidase n=1 Tax=Danaus plexippus TaxID=13037 RepID=UPI002AB04B2E|nr:alpha-N-acetylglucosaminidase [Danaus plexippus]
MKLLLYLSLITSALCLNLDYLDPLKLQTISSPEVQRQAALDVINSLLRNQYSFVAVDVNPILFNDHKDVFSLRTDNGKLNIRASSGVAAVWGFNYYLKKYCKSQVAWQVSRVVIPSTIPEADETVIANDRFRYYQNVCTASYSFVWWDTEDWKRHVTWMALNGINMALAPVAQEAAWTRVYKQLGMTDDEIKEHFTGPGFLAWLRMGNVHGWGGPLPQSWHDRQKQIQEVVTDLMFKLGMIPVFPAFNGHVPKAFEKIFPNTTFHPVETWNKFDEDYCCNLFVDPREPDFKMISKMFMREITAGLGSSHIYTADPFNEIKIQPWSTSLVVETAKAIFSSISEYDKDAVWLVQNWMFVHNPLLWPLKRVNSFLTSVPNGRMLVLDLQSEQWPQYDLYQMYYGQPFIWSMLHNFGGTLGMFGNTKTINKDVYEVRKRENSTMVGIGLTPEGINQNYVIYDLMLESAWRKGPVPDLEEWVSDYAERRYGCNATSIGWKYLLRSVYNFTGLNRVRGKYVMTRRPSFNIRPWAWYKGHDLFEALKNFVYVQNPACSTSGFLHDLVDVTRQALQYKIEQIYMNLQNDRYSNYMVFNYTISSFIDAMTDMQNILATSSDFKITSWLSSARAVSNLPLESSLYDFNARNQITLWGPNGEISDYACKQWAELFKYYYIPRWSTFLSMALDAKTRNEPFDEKGAQRVVRSSVEEKFASINIDYIPSDNPQQLALNLYQKWFSVSGHVDLPMRIIKQDPKKKTTLPDTDTDGEDYNENTPTVIFLHSTTPN